MSIYLSLSYLLHKKEKKKKKLPQPFSFFTESTPAHSLQIYTNHPFPLPLHTRTTAPLDKASKTRTAPVTKKINQAGAGATQTSNDATTNVGKLTNDTVQNIKRTTDSAVGDVATTVTDTGKAIGKRDVRGVGKGVARGEIFPRLPFFLNSSSSLSRLRSATY